MFRDLLNKTETLINLIYIYIYIEEKEPTLESGAGIKQQTPVYIFPFICVQVVEVELRELICGINAA